MICVSSSNDTEISFNEIYDDDILELLQKDNKFILNMRSECYDYLDSDTDTDTDIDTNVEIEPL